MAQTGSIQLYTILAKDMFSHCKEVSPRGEIALHMTFLQICPFKPHIYFSWKHSAILQLLCKNELFT